MSWVLDQKKLHITIGSSPQTTATGQTPKIDLKNDLELVKAALLYGDSAKLCSPVSAALLDLVTLTDPPEEERLDLLRRIRSWGLLDQDHNNKFDTILNFYEQAWRRRYSAKGQMALRQFRSALNEVWQDLRLEIEKIMSAIGVDGIARAQESGLLEVYNFNSIGERMLKREDHDLAWEYVNTVSAAVSDGRTYPLFDELTKNIISAGIGAGLIPVSDFGVSRGKEVGLAAKLFHRLPLFPDATVKEVLDIRRELETPLRRFRQGMVGFSDNIQNAAWDKHFTLDAENIFNRDVAPAILELEEIAKTNSFLSALLSKAAERSMQFGGVVSGSVALSGLAVTMSNIPLAGVAALSIGPLLAAAGIGYSAYKEWKSRSGSTEQNSLFFYYRTGALLEEGKYRYMSDAL